MNPVLVAGGAGYIGSHTVRELRRRNTPVVVVDNLSTGHYEALCTDCFYRVDIADTAMVEHIIKRHRIKSVMHFAAKSLVGESLARPEIYFYENTAKTFMFFNAALQAGVKHIVFSSSAAVYGKPGKIPIPEDLVPAPVNPYGVSKRMIEEYLQWVGATYRIGWVSLRYFNAAGASRDGSMGEDHRPETHLIPLVLQTALGLRNELSVFGTDYNTPDGSCIRDYIHVMDLADAHVRALQALESGWPGGIFNVGTGRGYSVLEIIKRAEAFTGQELPVKYEQRREGDPDILVADSTALKAALGWEPRYSDLETILSSAWRWHSLQPNGYQPIDGQPVGSIKGAGDDIR